MRRVAITGVGIVSSIGNNVEEVTASLRQGKSGIVASRDMDEHGFKSRIEGAINLNPDELFERKTRRFMGNAAAFSYVAMKEAIKDSGLEPSQVSNERTGLVVGSGGPSTKTIVAAADVTRQRGTTKRVGATQVPKAMSSTCSAVLSTLFKIRGLSYSISSACATSAHCIGNAAELIQWGKQDIVFAGGGEEVEWTLSVMFDAMGALSSKYNDSPATASRAYDRNRDGFVVSGGGGILVLEELDYAKARGADIYAEVVGYGATSDGDNMVAPSGEGAVRCMKLAMDTVSTPIDYINPHATSTPVGDSKEIEAIREVFGSNCAPIAATKSLTGHGLGAAGAQEAVYSLIMMKNNFICESAHIQDLDPELADMPILREKRDNVDLNCVLSNSFGFGGTNATLVMQRATTSS